MGTLIQNVRVGLRSLRRTPGFTFVAVVTLALGIGLSTAVFTIGDALLLRRLPVRDQGRLVVLWGAARDLQFNYPLDLAGANEFARESRALESAAVFLYNGAVPLAVRDGDQVSRLNRALVSGEFFNVLGARAALGRALGPTDDVFGAAPVVVLSHRAWEQRFNADPHVLGRQVIVYGGVTAYTIVGVMPQGLDYPKGTDFWAPVAASLPPNALPLMSCYVLGRLGPGATPSSSANEMTTFFSRSDAPSWQREFHGVATPWPQLVLGDVRPALIAFAAAAGLLLLITCINVANLLLVRGFARVREVAIRSALGGSRFRIVGQLLTESALLAIAGGALGIGVAAGAVQVFVAFAPGDLPRLDGIHWNAGALIAAIAITAGALVLFALVPAMLTSRARLQQTLRSDARQSASRRHRLGTEALVVGQLALALLVLSAAGVIAKSLIRLERVNLALEPSHLLIAELAESSSYGDAGSQRSMLERLLPELRTIPGVRAASTAVAPPFTRGGWDGKPVAEGQSPQEAATDPMLNMEVVAPGYFETLGTPVIRGRGFTDQDREGAPLAVIVSLSAAHHYWPNSDPIGKRLLMGPNRERVVTVIGIVPDTRYRVLRDARPSIYYPLAQSAFPFAPTTLAIRTKGDPNQLIPTIRRVIAQTEPGVALAGAAPFETLMEEPLAQPRLNAVLLAVFAAVAVLLAAVGLFGVMGTMVRQRTQELGIRLALGAAPRDLSRMVMRRGLAIGTFGLILGVIGAAFANHLLVALLFEVAPTDAPTMFITGGFLLVVAGLASALPARLSTRVDPLQALRAE